MNWHIPYLEAQQKLEGTEQLFVELMRHGSMSVELFRPRTKDSQVQHEQDELYVIVSGTAQLCKEASIMPCRKGDVIFVEAGMWHRFQHMSGDFETLSIFYGPKGGERITRSAL